MNARIEKYLKAYNLVQLAGWLLAIITLPVFFEISFCIICIVQLLSMLEIFHAYKKWNNSSPLFCFIQIGARLMILYFVFSFCKEEIFKAIVHLMFIAWCTAEVIRYAYYISELYKEKHNKFLWLRYNAFIICYPIGLICEIYILINVFVISSSFLKILIVLILLAYVIAFPMLYLHLLKQRKIKIIS